ncbi:MAG: FemAB family XrtA/PEP-CTERM system-associated protein [Phycisphaeraceae bacterium]
MIQVHEQPDAAVVAEVAAYVAAAGTETGACEEHDPRWLAVLREGLGHRPMMLVARGDSQCDIRNPKSNMQGDTRRCAQSGSASACRVENPKSEISGYLPLALVASRLFGRFLVSLPYLNRGGVVADDAATAVDLIDKAAELADQLDVQYLELRHGQPIAHPRLNAQRDEKKRMVLELPRDADALWKDLDAKVRNQVRKGDKHELTLRWGGLDVLDAFYDIFAVNMRDLGTPVFPRKLFAAILTHFKGEAELAVADCQNQPVAAALLIHSQRGSTQVPSASALRQFNHTNANMWMYHRLLLRAIERGSREFDFGRSSQDAGTYRFKKQWGAEPRETVWQYHQRRGDINSMRPDNPRYQRRIALWQKMPVWATRLIGPSIVKGIP